jgi:hypothetical protein
MQRSIRPAVLAVAIAVSIAALPTALDAQSRRDWAISPRGGLAIPLNDLGRAQDAGFTAGVGLERIVERTGRRHPMWGVRLDVDVDRLAGATDSGSELPKATILRYVLGAEYWFTSDPNSAFSARARGGFGGSTLWTDGQSSTGDPSGTFATIAAGLSAGLSVFYIDTQWATIFAGNRLRGQYSVRGNFKSLHVLSLRAGLRIPM